MQGNSEQTVCFSPVKHKFLKVIEQKIAGCEIKCFKRTERNDILITDCTFIKKMKFTQHIQNAVFQEITTLENELPLFDNGKCQRNNL